MPHRAAVFEGDCGRGEPCFGEGRRAQFDHAKKVCSLFQRHESMACDASRRRHFTPAARARGARRRHSIPGRVDHGGRAGPGGGVPGLRLYWDERRRIRRRRRLRAAACRLVQPRHRPGSFGDAVRGLCGAGAAEKRQGDAGDDPPLLDAPLALLLGNGPRAVPESAFKRPPRHFSDQTRSPARRQLPRLLPPVGAAEIKLPALRARQRRRLRRVPPARLQFHGPIFRAVAMGRQQSAGPARALGQARRGRTVRARGCGGRFGDFDADKRELDDGTPRRSHAPRTFGRRGRPALRQGHGRVRRGGGAGRRGGRRPFRRCRSGGGAGPALRRRAVPICRLWGVRISAAGFGNYRFPKRAHGVLARRRESRIIRAASNRGTAARLARLRRRRSRRRRFFEPAPARERRRSSRRRTGETGL
mmetsp:Transcript_6821/g.22071  ORF Transcript_6821/g.22071 Transcript_6821/m.22071 type:complete len:418 (-) Transcript_6821:1931-3184(-)